MKNLKKCTVICNSMFALPLPFITIYFDVLVCESLESIDVAASDILCFVSF